MKGFAIGLIVAVVLLTLVVSNALSAHTDTNTEAVAALVGGFGFLLVALCFYALADIRSLLLKK
jgi:hypothetical protein